MIRKITGLSRRIVRQDADGIVYRRLETGQDITIRAARSARRSFSQGHRRHFEDDTDSIPEVIETNGALRTPVVCALPEPGGCFLGGYLDPGADTIVVSSTPLSSPSEAARQAVSITMDASED